MTNHSNILKDYGYQYLQLNDKLIDEYFRSVQKRNKDYLLFHGYSIKGIIRKRLFAKFIYDDRLRLLFNESIINNEFHSNDFREYYKAAFNRFELNKSDLPILFEKFNTNIKKEIEDNLKKYRNKIICYAPSIRFLNIALPILSKLSEDVLILTYEDMSKLNTQVDNIIILEFPVIKINVYKNEFLQLKFPVLYYLFNSLYLMFTILKPSSIVIFEGANIVEYEMLAIFGKKYKIPSICIQHGWPGLIYSGFKEMKYDYFLSWGDRFNKLLKPWNQQLLFSSTGYPYKLTNNTSKNAISFFFQGPYFISNSEVVKKMIDFVIFCANTFRHLDILVREHPSHKLTSLNKNAFSKYPNIKLVPSSEVDLKDVLSKSIVSVSVFSSTLMESLIYNSIPFIFNLTTMPNYYPNLHKEKLGIEVNTLYEAKKNMLNLLSTPDKLNKFQKRIQNSQKEFFKYNGDKAISNIVKKIEKITYSK